jgi:hypothetical protein
LARVISDVDRDENLFQYQDYTFGDSVPLQIIVFVQSVLSKRYEEQTQTFIYDTHEHNNANATVILKSYDEKYCVLLTLDF